MIISADFIRKYRTLAQNIKEDRIDVCITEAEQLDIMPRVGATIIMKWRNVGAIIVDNMGSVLQDEQGNDIIAGDLSNLTGEEYKLLNGGVYKDACGVNQWFAGVKVALAYYAYARFVKANSAQVTAYGVVIKEGDESRSASAQMVAEMASDARNIADSHMEQALAYWRTRKHSNPSGTKPAKRHFIAVGD